MAGHCETAEPQTVTARRFNVLLVEDNPGDARLIRESLTESTSEPFDLETADRLATALRRLSEGGIDAVLLDLALPDSMGQETFERARAQAPTVPIIVLTGLGDEAMALKMVRKGAQDYVAKIDLKGSLLSRAIRYAIERERAEQQMRQFNEELDQRVKQRTAELEAANAELEAFSYSVSHDLRAPLRHIDGFSNLLLEAEGERIGTEGRQYVERIHKSVQQMGVMIEGLLNLAQRARQPLNLQPVDLNRLVARVIDDLRSETSGRQIEWRVGELPTTNCDRGLMQQVFVNLLANSVKYTRLRESAVIELGKSCVEGESAVFVRDNGAGFDMRHAGKLFGAFQRLHSAEQFEGTGVGLATVRRIVQRHGGRIWAESEPDRGATFYFTVAAEPARQLK